VSVTVSVSEGYSEKNIGMTVDASMNEIARVTARDHDAAAVVDAVVSCCFGSRSATSPRAAPWRRSSTGFATRASTA
jgi:hypothetical protein